MHLPSWEQTYNEILQRKASEMLILHKDYLMFKEQ